MATGKWQPQCLQQVWWCARAVLHKACLGHMLCACVWHACMGTMFSAQALSQKQYIHVLVVFCLPLH